MSLFRSLIPVGASLSLMTVTFVGAPATAGSPSAAAMAQGLASGTVGVAALSSATASRAHRGSGSVLVSVKGDHLGRPVSLVLRGKGLKKKARTKKNAKFGRLPAGRYVLKAKVVSTASAQAKPRPASLKVRVSAGKARKVVITYERVAAQPVTALPPVVVTDPPPPPVEPRPEYEAPHDVPVATFVEPSAERINDAEPLNLLQGKRLRDEVTVVLGTDDAPGDRAAADAVAYSVGAVVVGGSQEMGIYQIRWPSQQDVDARIRQLEAMPGVTGVDAATLDSTFEATVTNPDDWSDDGPDGTWHLQQARLPQAWNGSSVDTPVGIVDGGWADKDHEDLNVTYRDESNDSSVTHWHATHVAGLACAKGNGKGVVGAAWGCPILTSQRRTTTNGILRSAIDVVVEGARVVNISMGYIPEGPEGESRCATPDEITALSQADDEAFRRFTRTNGRKVVYTISAGNNCTPAVQGVGGPKVGNPDNVITVAAANSDGTMARFSSWGAEVAAGGGVGVPPLIDRSGNTVDGKTGVWSTMPKNRYGPAWGTSMAAPIVAGVAALLRSRHPDWDAAKVGKCIVDSAGTLTGYVTDVGAFPAWYTPQVDLSSAADIPLLDAETALQCGNQKNHVLVFGTPYRPSGTSNIEGALTSAGYAVTVSPTLPHRLGTFGQVWWYGMPSLSAADQQRLIDYATRGGGLYLTGEWQGCNCNNSSISPIVDSLLGSPGALRFGPDLATGRDVTVVNPFVKGNLATYPNTLATNTTNASGTIAGDAFTSDHFVFLDGNANGTMAVWTEQELVGGVGRLVVMMDINWAQTEYGNLLTIPYIAQNAAAFLKGARGVDPALRSSHPGQPKAAAPSPSDRLHETTVPPTTGVPRSGQGG